MAIFLALSTVNPLDEVYLRHLKLPFFSGCLFSLMIGRFSFGRVDCLF